MIIAIDAQPLVTRQVSGVEQHARNIVAEWGRHGSGHQFLLLCDKWLMMSADFDDTFIRSLPDVFRIVPLSRLRFSANWLVNSQMLDSLSRLLRKNEVDVFHSFTARVPQTSVCPIVQTIHDLSVELDPAVRRLSASRKLRTQTKTGAKWAARIIAVSLQTQNDISSLYDISPERISVVPNGINPSFVPHTDLAVRDELRQRFNVPNRYVLAVGSDIPRRNYARLLTAMQQIWKTTDPAVKFLVVGRNNWVQTDLYRRAQQAGVMGNMVFLQSPSDEDLAKLYSHAVVTVCGSSFEGFGLSVLEGMACGSPVACSDMPSLREVAENAAVYFTHDDPSSMSQTIGGLLEDAEYRRQMRYRGLARAKLFTWSAAAQRILGIFEELQPVPA